MRGLDFFDTYFSTGTVNPEDIEYLKSFPFSGLLSNEHFTHKLFGVFDDDVTIGSIFELCFSDTIQRIQTLDFTFNSTPDLNKEPKLKELIKTILKNNIDPVLLKDNLLQFAEEIRELINLVKDFTNNHSQTNNNKKEINLLDFLNNKSDLEKLKQIQDEFSAYNGKRMAIMIYLLISEFNFIKIVPHSKTHSRTQFIRLFKNNYDIKTQSIDKYFNSWDNGISIVASDIELLDMKAKLTKIIENQVV